MLHSQKEAFARAIELKGEEDDPDAIVTKALEEFQAKVDDRLKKLEEKAGAPETKSKDADEKKAADKLNERLDKIEAKVNRPATGGNGDERPEAAEERKAWLTYIRKGAQTDDADLKTLTSANDEAGGYLAPTEVSSEFIRELTEISPIRQYASVRTSAAPAVRYPKRTGLTNAKWEGEIEESEESEPTFGQTEIVSRRLTTFVDISNSLIMGSNGTAEAEVRQAFAEDFAKKQGLAFVSGSGVKEPEGLLTSTAISSVLNGHATNLSADALIGLMYSLPSIYRNLGVWVLNGTTLGVVRKLKDGQNNYLWQPSFQAGQPETILGRPVAEAVDMPDAEANATPILFGDLGTGYRIVDRQQLNTLSDPYTQARKGITRIHGTVWVGAGVVQPAAMKKLKMATS
jgi:HK97 family phage major capsid protein